MAVHVSQRHLLISWTIYDTFYQDSEFNVSLTSEGLFNAVLLKIFKFNTNFPIEN